MKVLLGSLIRKFIFGACAAWITAAVDWLNKSGAMEDGQIDVEKAKGIIAQIVLAAVLMAGSALWSYIKRKIEAKKAG